MEFIRLEHKEDGYGIFRTNVGRWNLSSHPVEFKVNDMPTPHDEGRYIKDDEYCAFPSLEILFYWCPIHELIEMVKNGIRVFKISGVVEFQSEHQVFFKKEEIREKIDITEKIMKGHDLNLDGLSFLF